jgi:hypothetical protein
VFENDWRLSRGMSEKISQHLQGLKSSLEKYFPKPGKENNWMANPFEEESLQTASLSISEKDKLIELSTHSTVISYFNEKFLINLCTCLSTEYQQLSNKALMFLLPFTSTELVERAFSYYTFI